METISNVAIAQNLTEAQKLSFDMMCNCQTPVVKSAWDEYSHIIEKLGQTLLKMPHLYEQDGKGYDAIVYAHFFIGSTDIFVTERDGDEMFGYVILNGDFEMSELGYISLKELKELAFLNLDFHWRVKTLRQALKKRSKYFNYL